MAQDASGEAQARGDPGFSRVRLHQASDARACAAGPGDDDDDDDETPIGEPPDDDEGDDWDDDDDEEEPWQVRRAR